MGYSLGRVEHKVLNGIVYKADLKEFLPERRQQE